MVAMQKKKTKKKTTNDVILHLGISKLFLKHCITYASFSFPLFRFSLETQIQAAL